MQRDILEEVDNPEKEENIDKNDHVYDKPEKDNIDENDHDVDNPESPERDMKTPEIPDQEQIIKIYYYALATSWGT